MFVEIVSCGNHINFMTFEKKKSDEKSENSQFLTSVDPIALSYQGKIVLSPFC